MSELKNTKEILSFARETIERTINDSKERIDELNAIKAKITIIEFYIKIIFIILSGIGTMTLYIMKQIIVSFIHFLK